MSTALAPAILLEPVAPLEREPATLEEQHVFNLAVWARVLADPWLQSLPYRIETDRYGHILMSVPPAPEHGESQSDLAFHLRSLLPHGKVITECPISTSAGTRHADVAWRSRERRRTQRGQVCLTRAPEVCAEVFSPSNSRAEMREKKALYFEAGAEEVWFCHRDGRMEFFLKAAPETASASVLCPTFPAQIETEN